MAQNYEDFDDEEEDFDDDFDMDDEDFDPDDFDEEEESTDTRECNCGKKGGCCFEIDECFEEGMDEDSLPCSDAWKDN